MAGKVTPIVDTWTPADVPDADRGTYDLVFIDGAHDAVSVANDIAVARELLAPGGLIAFHDYRSPEDPDIAPAVDALIAAGGELLSLTETLAVVRPPAESLAPLEV